MNPAIIIMCKSPRAGGVKTRLAPILSGDQAAGLAVCFARDVSAKAQAICKNTFIAFAPDDGKELLEQILPENLLWTAQVGKNLGERMHNALVSVFTDNYAPLVVIGTDSPTLPPEYIEQAFEVLSQNRADVVLGRCEDGGYYLIGLNTPDSRIFADVKWSSPRTFKQTVRNIKNLGLRLETLPVWYDVDLIEDLRRLREEIFTDENAAQLAPRTANWLRQTEKLF